MDEWGHPYGMQGITYIATGMNLNMLNEARMMNLSYRTDRDLQKEAYEIATLWESKKKKWRKNAALEPSLKSFLWENFYKYQEEK